MNLGRLAISLPVSSNIPICIAWAQRAEALGYESTWIADSSGPDPFVLAGVVARATQHLRIGIAVSPVYIRTPAVIAAAAATVAQLAPNRFILGLGASSHTIVEHWHGIPFRRPLTRVRETVTTVRAMLAGEKVKFAGETLRTSGFRVFEPPPDRVPIYVGALRPAMLELAGEVGDGVALNLFPAQALPRMLEHVARGAQRAGRDWHRFEVVCRQQVLVTDDKNGARELLRQRLSGYFATPVYNKFAAWYGFEDEAALIAEGFRTGNRELTRKGMTDRFLDSIAVFGPLEECRERLAAYVANGVTTTVLSPFSADGEAIRRTLEGLAR